MVNTKTFVQSAPKVNDPSYKCTTATLWDFFLKPQAFFSFVFTSCQVNISKEHQRRLKNWFISLFKKLFITMYQCIKEAFI